MGGVLLGAGVRFLQDQQQRFTRTGLPVYLRLKNFDDADQQYVEMGFRYAPTGGQATGYMDVKIDPPPEVREVSLHNIGLNQTRLFFGARYFIISHSFVRRRAQEQRYADYYDVFRDGRVVGIFYNERLFSIESITHEETGGDIITWTLLCNAQERKAGAT